MFLLAFVNFNLSPSRSQTEPDGRQQKHRELTFENGRPKDTDLTTQDKRESHYHKARAGTEAEPRAPYSGRLPAKAMPKEPGPQCDVITFCVLYQRICANPSSRACFSTASCTDCGSPDERTK